MEWVFKVISSDFSQIVFTSVKSHKVPNVITYFLLIYLKRSNNMFILALRNKKMLARNFPGCMGNKILVRIGPGFKHVLRHILASKQDFRNFLSTRKKRKAIYTFFERLQSTGILWVKHFYSFSYFICTTLTSPWFLLSLL